ncbi:Nickel uptake substrate-specific transmembrane region [Planctomycetes bacterium Poly30]|uniref:Nickel uptake substrate-specific transmembrane region n=1 Tax=Saltatorellus ferox TaxID=2528018 RepID=A0A518ET52_9BACT|nr:Nickel uptake substrate-specific transmembrane region [Planctomycetes bacterium Poly30]
MKLTLPVLFVLAVLVGGWLWHDSVEEGPGGIVPVAVRASDDSRATPERVHLAGGDQAAADDLGRTALAPPSQPVEQAPVQTTEADTTPWAQLELTVLDRVTGAPVVGVFADFEPVMSPGAEKPETPPISQAAIETDRDGRLTVQIQPRLAFEYRVLFAGSDPRLFEGFLEPFDPGEERDVELRVDSSRVPRFYVRIVDHATDEVLLGARIVEVDRFGQGLHMEGPLDFETWRERPSLAIVGGDGIAELPRSRFVQKRYAALMDGYSPGVFEQSRAAKKREYAQRVGLLRGASLEVSVSDGSGYPVSAATVRFETEFPELQAPGSTPQMPAGLGTHAVSTTTDSSGKASFRGLPAAGAYELHVASTITGGRDVPVPFAHEDLEPGQTVELDVVVQPLGSIVGTAFLPNGEPAAGAQLVLRRDRGDEGLLMGPFEAPNDRRITTGHDGSFELTLVPAGDWLLGPPGIQVEAVESEDDALPLDRHAPTFTKISLGGELSTSRLRMELDPGDWIRGVVLDEAGEPVESAFVRGRFGESDAFWGQTGPSGRFRLGPLPSSEVEITVDGYEQGTCPLVHVLPGSDPIELRLALGGTLSLRTVEASTSEEVACRFEFRKHGPNGEVLEKSVFITVRGTVDDHDLSAGTWSVLALGPNDLMAFVGGITIEAGLASEPIEMALAPAGDLVIQRAPNARSVDIELRRGGLVFARCSVPANDSLTVPVPTGQVSITFAGDPRESRRVHVPAGGKASVLLDADEHDDG